MTSDEKRDFCLACGRTGPSPYDCVVHGASQMATKVVSQIPRRNAYWSRDANGNKKEFPVDIFVCLLCGKVKTAPNPRTYEPQVDCWHAGEIFVMTKLDMKKLLDEDDTE